MSGASKKKQRNNSFEVFFLEKGRPLERSRIEGLVVHFCTYFYTNTSPVVSNIGSGHDIIKGDTTTVVRLIQRQQRYSS